MVLCFPPPPLALFFLPSPHLSFCVSLLSDSGNLQIPGCVSKRVSGWFVRFSFPSSFFFLILIHNSSHTHTHTGRGRSGHPAGPLSHPGIPCFVLPSQLYHTGQPVWLSVLVPPSAQGVILESRDRVPRQAPCTGACFSLCVFAPPPPLLNLKKKNCVLHVRFLQNEQRRNKKPAEPGSR